MFFPFFLNLDFLGSYGGKKGGQEMAQDEDDKKSCLFGCCSILETIPIIMWFSFMVHLFKIMISVGAFFFFFKILIFWVVFGEGWKGKRAKIVQNEKNSVCHTPCMSQRNHTFYIIWFLFMVLMCKMVISPVFLFYQKFDFLGC